MKKLDEKDFQISKTKIYYDRRFDWPEELINPLKDMLALNEIKDIRYVKNYKNIFNKARQSGFVEAFQDNFHRQMQKDFFPWKRQEFMMKIEGVENETIYINTSPENFSVVAFQNEDDASQVYSMIHQDISAKNALTVCLDLHESFEGDVNKLYFNIILKVAILQFFTFDEVTVNPFSTQKAHGSKYQNRSNNPIKVIDIPWFKNLHILNPVNIRGHFRNQACGQNMEERKVIWIEKHRRTYSRMAKNQKQ